MRRIDITASNWVDVLDFYDAILASLGAPAGHGRSIDALIDSMVWGGMNAIEQPYIILLRGTAHLPAKVVAEMRTAKDALAEACDEARVRGKNVFVTIEFDAGPGAA